ncbi:LptF/LptG family permease [Muricoccus pecuniae]|uniref:Lipopolysaccharide export system permease protein n=1 Tax=Muricoccus pecuniae TaxID=693023 RepID=A0A840XZ25_9PROT|nr:LptF/LptG family permease [Roseomonas pecuniae]MBB5694078.1 lipopolysaccharide export system permease protein [Roseomonas pecuniae]
MSTDPIAPAYRGLPAAGGLVSRYMLRLLARPLAATLLLVLPALLLERLLRLFDLLAGAGSPASSILQLLLYLVPHYLGLAVPAALFLAVYVVIARLSQDHELDALQASGISLARLGRPFLAVGLVCAALGIGLYGYAQPLSRYAYRAAYHALTNAGWNASLVPGEFARAGRRFTVSVDRREPGSGLLHGITIHQRLEGGGEVLTTAATGRMLFSSEESELLIELEDGQQITIRPDGEVSTLAFSSSAQSRPFVRRLPIFRLRGGDEREMTLGELWASRDEDEPPVERRRMDGELHGRLVRAASLLVLPLLAMPMGLAAKRSSRSVAILLGAVILVVYQQALQLAESLGDVGRIDPRPALWGMFILFSIFAALVFRHSNRHPEEGAFDGLLARLDAAAGALAALLPRRGTAP